MSDTRPIKTFIGIMVLAGTGAAACASWRIPALHLYFTATVLALSVATSRMKAKLPGIDGNMSMNLPFLLTAIVNLNGVEVLVITFASTLAQCWPSKGNAFRPVQLAFNLAMMSFATCTSSLIYHLQGLRSVMSVTGIGVSLATAALMLGQTVPVSGIVALSERESAWEIWKKMAQLSFPYYVLSAGLTTTVQAVSSHLGWQLALAVFPVMYAVHCSYRLYFGKIAETLRTEVHVRAAGAGA